MALMPKRVKFRKSHRGRIRGRATRANTVEFGEFGLQSLEPAWLNAKCIEAGRVTASHFVRGEGRLYIRVFPSKSVSSRPPETRMGKGKGAPEAWVAVIKPGRVMFEMEGVEEKLAREAMRLAAHKLPIKTRFVSRQVS